MVDIVKARRIVVGVDGSVPSKLALRWAVRQATLTGAMVDAIHTWDVPTTFDMPPVFVNPTEIEKNAEQTLVDAVSDVVGAHCPVAVRARVVQGHPASVLLRTSRNAALLVLGSRGRGGFVGALLGSVSQHCVHHATCPVVVVRAPHGTARNGP
jgi:nucleotide-binding universal stress UspA family protein